MIKNEALRRLRLQLQALDFLTSNSNEINRWQKETELTVEYLFGIGSRHLLEIRKNRWVPRRYDSLDPEPDFQRAFESGRAYAKSALSSMIHEVEEFWDGGEVGEPLDAVARVHQICSRFHLVARQLLVRHAGRTPIVMTDEYDVQDLLHALLRIDFNDIRPEEWTPSYAGKSARVDILLKQEMIVIEAKRTRRSLSTKELGDQLIIDIARYKRHPDCKHLVCMIYDPDGRIKNAASLEQDLSGVHDALNVEVIVTPRGT